MKELKRYILTNRNKIFDLSMQHILGNSSMLGGWGKGRNSYIGHRLEIGEEYPIENETEQGFIIKTSDDILDLVEVGDLVKHNKYGVIEIIGDNRYTLKGFIYTSDVSEILKLQRNGDFKRYQVKGEIKWTI